LRVLNEQGLDLALAMQLAGILHTHPAHERPVNIN